MLKRRFKRLSVSALVVCLFATALQAQRREALVQTVDATPEWSVAGEAVQFDESNLETFDAELAPILRLYGVDGIARQAWDGPQGQLQTTLFEMFDAQASYGFFTMQRRAASSTSSTVAHDPVGTESFQSGNRLYLWQSNYVVRVDGPPQAANALARTVAANILGRSEKPQVAYLLPPADLVAGSDTYVLRAEDIADSFDVNVAELGFEDSAEAATALYRNGQQSARLLLLLYPTQQLADKYADQLDASAGPSPLRKRVVRLMAIVAGTTDEGFAQSILDQVNNESKVTWNEPPPDLSVATMLITIFSFIGVAMVVILVVGVGYGGLRVWVKSRFPGKVFDRPEDMEVIQLKLDQGLIRKELGE